MLVITVVVGSTDVVVASTVVVVVGCGIVCSVVVVSSLVGLITALYSVQL